MQKDVELAVNRILECMSDGLSKGHRIEIRGFGSLTCRYRAPRKAHNPRTGERVYTTGKYTPHFKPGKEMRERVDQSRLTVPLKDSPDNEDDNS